MTTRNLVLVIKYDTSQTNIKALTEAIENLVGVENVQ
jgi:hypothetical protein